MSGRNAEKEGGFTVDQRKKRMVEGGWKEGKKDGREALNKERH